MNRPFDIEEALNGAKVQTVSGAPVYGLHHDTDKTVYVLCGYIGMCKEIESWTKEGSYLIGDDHEKDLVMAPPAEDEPEECAECADGLRFARPAGAPPGLECLAEDMKLRDYFAAEAIIAGMIIHDAKNHEKCMAAAKLAYTMADAMLNVRDRHIA